MASLSLGGINLDVQGLVSQLMQVESRPLLRLQEEGSEYQSRLSALGRLKSALSAFQTSMGNLGSLDKFETYKVATSEDDSNRSFTVETDKDASVGNFEIQVTQLAQSSKYGSDSLNPFADKNSTTINSSGDPLTINVGSDSMNVAVDGLTLQGVRDAINTAAESNDLAVSASIVSTKADEHYLVITGTDTGVDNAVTITDNNAKTALNLGTGTAMEIQSALNSEVVVDGQYTISSATNTVSDAISGVTLNLLKDSNPAADLNIDKDLDAAKTSVGNFVSAYNTLYSTINALKKEGLEGDSILNSVLSSIRSEFNANAGLSGDYNFLSEVGVRTNAKTGELELDNETLEKAIANDYDAVAQLFANDNRGVAFRLEEKMDDYLSFDGLIKSREEGIRSRIDYNDKQQSDMEYRLEQIEAQYLKQFSALDSIISESNNTSNYLSQQLASLPGFASK
jgi:flagellar hook-associated protein 2